MVTLGVGGLSAFPWHTLVGAILVSLATAWVARRVAAGPADAADASGAVAAKT